MLFPRLAAPVLSLLAALSLAVPARAATDLTCDEQAYLIERMEGARDFLPDESHFSRTLERVIRQFARRYADGCVRLNQVQVLGSHNSYHIEPVQSLIDVYLNFQSDAEELQYTHRPLDEQFEELGVRQIELDVFADPDGGLYADPVGLIIRDGFPARLPELDAPGLKVLHIQEIDWESTCPFFEQCLEVVKAWSDDHPGHLPILILVEVKDEAIIDPLGLGFTIPLPFGAAEFDEVDAVVRRVFPPSRLITPDDVRGGYATLREAALAGNWPKLRHARGKVMFGLDNAGLRQVYADGHPSLEGRVMFVDADPSEDFAAFVKENDPLGREDAIRDLVEQGFIVRTRSDSGTLEARANDTTRREAALGSGAHFVSTDYEEPDSRPEFNGFTVAIPQGAPGRCNPVNAPSGCRNWALER